MGGGKGMNDKPILMIDPEDGWKYGFPKPVEDEDALAANPDQWLIEHGYPANKLRSGLPVTMWYE